MAYKLQKPPYEVDTKKQVDSGHQHCDKSLPVTSMLNAPQNHPRRLSRNPTDTTDGEEYRPDEPAEPPDMPKGTRMQGGQQRARKINQTC